MNATKHLFHKTSWSGFTAVLALLCGCSGAPIKQPDEIPAQRQLESAAGDHVERPIEVYDPIEGFNRGVYRFNAGFDKYVFLPVVDVYETILPDFVEDRISDFFNNFFEITNFTNALLQLKPKATGGTLVRFVVNSTVGMLGLFDVAKEMGIYEYEEDFGQTLGHYGVGNGPYIVLPVLGPSNLRDTTGIVVDSAAFIVVDPFNFANYMLHGLAFDGTYAIDRRHKISFRYYETGSPFEYELVRFMYTKKRQLDIAR